MQRLISAVSVAVVMFFVALGIMVGKKMDQNTIALLGGAVIGLLVATPCAAIMTYWSMRRRPESYDDVAVSMRDGARNGARDAQPTSTFQFNPHRAPLVLGASESRQAALATHSLSPVQPHATSAMPGGLPAIAPSMPLSPWPTVAREFMLVDFNGEYRRIAPGSEAEAVLNVAADTIEAVYAANGVRTRVFSGKVMICEDRDLVELICDAPYNKSHQLEGAFARALQTTVRVLQAGGCMAICLYPEPVAPVGA